MAFYDIDPSLLAGLKEPDPEKKKKWLGGLLDADPNSPAAQGLLGMAAQMLQASGPSRTPVSFGQALGSGLQGMQQGRANATQQGFQRQELQGRQAQQEMQRKLMEAQIGQLNKKDPGITDYQRDLIASGIDPNSDIGRKILQNRYDKTIMNPLQSIQIQEKIRELSKPSLTKGQEAVDSAFAKEYVDFKAAGGFADVQKGIEQVGGVLAELESGDKNLTGPVVGRMGDTIRSVFNPEAQSAKDSVEEVVQRNLRLVLGAQFTEREGERLIARAYNPNLGEAENAKRLRRLVTQIGTAAQAKQEAADYFEQNGTLKGFKGKIYTAADFTTMRFDEPKGASGQSAKTWEDNEYMYRRLPDGTVQRKRK